MAETVVKRNGHVVPFDKEKISTAILKAMKYGSGVEKEKIANDPELRKSFTEEQIEEIEEGDTPRRPATILAFRNRGSSS